MLLVLMVSRETLFDELDTVGSAEDVEAADRPVIRLMEDIHEHGEVHAEFADDATRYVELRKGTTLFDFEAGVFAVDDGITTHRFAMHNLTNWHKPRNVFESD